MAKNTPTEKPTEKNILDDIFKNIENTISSLEKTEFKTYLKDIKAKENFIKAFINTEKSIDKNDKETLEKIRAKINNTLYNRAFNDIENTSAYYYYTYNKNGSKTIHFNKAVKDILIKEYGIDKLNTSYNEYKDALRFYSILSVCNDKNIYHNIDRETA